MRAIVWVGMLAISLVAAPSAGWSQRGVINYEDLSQRNTRSTERDDKKKEEAKKAEDAKRKADEEKKRDERRKESEQRRENDNKDDKKPGDTGRGNTAATSNNGRPSTGTKTAAMGQPGNTRKPAGKGASQARNAGGSTDPTAREVTEVMLDAVRTQSVNFDVEEAEKNPTMIMLNAPKFDPKDRIRAGDSDMGQAL